MEQQPIQKPKLSFLGAVHLAAPHTWPAAVLPVLLGAALSLAAGGPIRPWVLLGTLVTAVLLQSAINTLNDFRDFVSGLDNADNCTDDTDAALIYECSSPKAALALGLGFLLCAALLGGGLTAACGAELLVYGALALAAILLYILPGRSLSDLPLGELLSGVTMGGVLTCASFHAQAGALSPAVPLWCLPPVLTIGSIMLVNNTSDIEKDQLGGRKTLSVCIGRTAAQHLLRTSLAAAAAAVVLIVLFRFPGGAAALPVLPAVLVTNRQVRTLFTTPLLPERRSANMGAVVTAHVWINTVYVTAAVLARAAA